MGPKVSKSAFIEMSSGLWPIATKTSDIHLGTPWPWSLLKATRSIPMPCRPAIEAGDQRGVNIGKRRLVEDSSFDSENNLLWVIELQGNCLGPLPLETYPPVFSRIHQPILGLYDFQTLQVYDFFFQVSHYPVLSPKKKSTASEVTFLDTNIAPKNDAFQ